MISILDTTFIKDSLQLFVLFFEIVRALSLDVMFDQQFKIFVAVVFSVSVFVVNDLTSQKRSSEPSCHNKAMFEDSWRAVIFLAHSFAKNSIFWGKAGNDKADIALTGYGSHVSFFVSWIRGWRDAVAASAKSREKSLHSVSRKQSISSHPSCVAAVPANYLKSHGFLVENGPDIPMDSASFDQVNVFGLDRVGDWFSHSNYPFKNLLLHTGIIAENSRLCRRV